MSTLALVHPTDLVGDELRTSLDRRRDLWDKLVLLSSLAEEVGTLTQVRGAAAMVQVLEADSLRGIDVAFFSGPVERNRRLLAALPPETAAVVLSPDAGPEDGHPVVAGVNLETARRDTPLLCPHPAVVALAHLLHPLLGFGLRRSAATVLQPISTHGKAGLDEVLQQTRAILAFADNPPRDVFPIQMAFNTVPGSGTAAGVPPALLRQVLSIEAPTSIHLLQAGIFHSLGISLHVELDRDPGAEALAGALAAHPANELAPDPDLLGPIDAAARDEVLIGRIEPDAESPGAYRLWAVMDNLTCGGSLNAVQILEAIGRQATH